LAAAEAPPPRDAVLKEIDFHQKLDEQVPPGLRFRDEGGGDVLLSDAFRGKPVVLALVYYRCPMLCTETLNGLLRAARALSFDAGRQYRVVVVSIDPREGAALASAKKALYVQRYGRAGGDAGWSFLTGEEADIRRLAEAVGFRYAYDAVSGQYAHPAGITVLTPGGRISRYLFGVEYSARDLKLSLMDAAAGRIGSPVDKILLACYRYDPLTGTYGLLIAGILKVAAAATALGLAGAIFWMSRRGPRRTA
jgi:protein SCO1/2